ncbi:MAG TPA: RpiB/LacA/LacB family sugar-phosphate isomerase [Chloroflexia bacterium]|nr:RpiB/LacA/LacB family sugar-phosphate isomerase [Chloroflexia bacterium]
MKIAVGSDEKTYLTDAVVAELEKRGHQLKLFGPLAGEQEAWARVSQQLAESVAQGETEQGVLFCWTGTGASIAANKVPGIRAALCHDAQTARGARWWNDANVLVMSLRATPEAVAKEILDSWFSEKALPEEEANIAQVSEIEQKYYKK